MDAITQGVHRLPEARVFEGRQLFCPGQCGQRFAFPGGGIAVDIVKTLGRENEKAAVDPASIAAWLFDEFSDGACRDVQGAVSARRLYGGDGRQLVMAFVEGDQAGNVDVGNAVAIGKAEGLVVFDKIRNPLETAAGHGVFAGIDERYPPGLGMPFMYFHAVIHHVERYIRHVQEVIGEVLLDDIAFVAAANDEIVNAVMGVHLEDVPEDRFAANFDHWLGLQMGLFRNPGAKATS